MRKFFLFVAATLVAMSFTFVYANNIIIRVKETGQTMVYTEKEGLQTYSQGLE